MKHILTILLITLAFSFQLVAGEGDTTRVQSHQLTHWDWNGNWYDTTSFPETGSYKRILMYYTLGCPSQGCADYDYTTSIEVEDPIDDSTSRWVELTRIMTPFSGDKGSGWNHTYIIDVTDYAPVLTGDRRVKAHYGGWADGYTVTIDFDFIEGTPAREVLAVNSVYDGTFKYGFANDPIESHLTPQMISIEGEMMSAKFRMVASGHSFGGNENCAEFCKKWYKLEVDGSEAVKEDVWRDDCGSNPIQGQPGTWIYNRGGWCPGDLTKRFDTEVGAFLTAGDDAELNVDWENYNYQGGAGFDPQYIIEATLFQYGEWEFENDVTIDDVIRPSKNDAVWEKNPICNNPEIVITNSGSATIFKAEFEYWVEGNFQPLKHKWTGYLKPGESTAVVLPSSDRWLFGGKVNNVFHVKALTVNESPDEYEGNSYFKSRFDNTSLLPEEFIIVFDNNNGGSETKYRVVDDLGNILYSRTNASSNGLYYDTISLDSGCYTLYIEDSGCDGLSYFNNNDGTGRIWVHSADEDDFFPPLHRFDSEFGCEAILSFTVGWELGDEQPIIEPEGIREGLGQYSLTAYPNPARDRITLAIEGEKEMGGTLSVFNHLGQRILDQKIIGRNGIEIDGLASGNYFAQYKTDHDLKTVQFVIVE